MKFSVRGFMLQTSRKNCWEWKCYLFVIWSFSPPWGNYRSKFSCKVQYQSIFPLEPWRCQVKLLDYQCCEWMVSAMTFSCWQRQNTPEEKTLILVLFIQLGAMSCQVLINVFRKWKGCGYRVASAYCDVGGTRLNFRAGPKWCVFKTQTIR